MKTIKGSIRSLSLFIFVLSIGFTLFSGLKILTVESSVEETLIEWDEKQNLTSTLNESPTSLISPIQLVSGQNHTTKNEKSTEEIMYNNRPKKGEVLGKISIPKIDKVFPIVEGTDQMELSKGVGHYQESVLPGESDNTVLAGHRDTVFQELGVLEINDHIVIQTEAGEFTYKINKRIVVDKNDRTIIVPSEEAILTLITCYPFNFIGPAPERFILQGKLLAQSN